MEMFENGQSPENMNNEAPQDNKPEQTIDPDLNRGGGVFAEEDFSKLPPEGVPVPPYQAQGDPCGKAYSSSADNAYRQMYSAAPDYRGYYHGTQNVNSSYNGGQSCPQPDGASENFPNGTESYEGNTSPQNGYEQPQRGYTPTSGYYYQPQV
ncbi:MAG: hypothetical protein J6K92_02995, partial [Oscillospiraceae bacterium]|nr:hypothetical protein [Oscillospiraceae bacterium]